MGGQNERSCRKRRLAVKEILPGNGGLQSPVERETDFAAMVEKPLFLNRMRLRRSMAFSTGC
jgi:hypothetical protein